MGDVAAFGKRGFPLVPAGESPDFHPVGDGRGVNDEGKPAAGIGVDEPSLGRTTGVVGVDPSAELFADEERQPGSRRLGHPAVLQVPGDRLSQAAEDFGRGSLKRHGSAVYPGRLGKAKVHISGRAPRLLI